MGFSFTLQLLGLCAALFATLGDAARNDGFDLRPFKIDLNSKIPRLKSLLQNTRIPEKDLYLGVGPGYGVEVETLRALKDEWSGNYSWAAEQEKLNAFDQYTAVVEGMKIHFVHEKSEDPDAIPIILLHGWPGSFHEFVPIIKPLTQPSMSSTGKNVSYHVVVPSLPGFVFSSPPPNVNWTTDDTARIFNTLMTEVLGYSKYAVHGTDWGCVVGYSLYGSYNTTVRGAQFTFIPFISPSQADIAANNITLDPIEQGAYDDYLEWSTTGNSYFMELTFKACCSPNDIGQALYDSPVGQLAWIGAKIKRVSDPRAGTPPSTLDNTAILTMVSLYYLTDTVISAGWVYAQNAGKWSTVYTKAPTDAPFLFSQYQYNTVGWPKEYIAKVGNLVSYTEHDFGGHFLGLDNPPALIGDIRELGPYFKAAL
ncbi:Alpha/Beta hydrolase protein [Mycena rosella]|uniref:Alpha/Beta hydrolase protein n=1 Tax=Mycena rosella TaxID=1033263 RepID=A0AAD7D4K3_MYCRO|nr:Alpha/Beta hydrolase protein [Mycena rosella]